MNVNESKLKDALRILYGEEPGLLNSQFERYKILIDKHKAKFGDVDLHIFSSPGRTELGGNHTDHNHGRVLAASVNLDTISVCNYNNSNDVTIYSEGYDTPFFVNLNELKKKREEEGTTNALIRGIAFRFKELGYGIGGFNTFVSSEVLTGSGLSSSASIEVLIGTIFNALYNENKISSKQIAIAGQYAENNYFGKPCGLMDQMASAFGGIISIDFEKPQAPKVETIDFDFESTGYKIIMVDTGGSHADLTDDYASIPNEMKSAAKFFNKEFCRDISMNDLLSNCKKLRSELGDRAILRAMHYIEENEKVVHQVSALRNNDFSKYLDKAKSALKILESGEGKGNDFLGWLNLPYLDDYIDIIETANNFRKKVDTVVIIGIGGSYLGARAVIEALKSTFEKTSPEIIYAGNNLSERYHSDLLKYLEYRNYGIIIISKSGTTTEPAVAFRLLKKQIEEKYGYNGASKRIIAVTDKEKGALKKLADKEGYKTFVITDDVGGRFSVLSPVGLLPIALAGFDIKLLLEGAKDIDEKSKSTVHFGQNDVLMYTALRNVLYSNGKKIEILTAYNPKLFYFIEWWKQLFGESEGKENKGIFTAGVVNTTDLHSLGQYVQEGERNLFETVLSIESPGAEVLIPSDKDNLDNLNYIAGKNMFEINQKAEEGTLLAHIEGDVPNLRITLPKLDEYYLGQLIFFFEKSCAVSGYILDVNPFDQPGVEAYKKNMFKLLGKPGYK